jgi:type II secretory ATPase GspE/PulE/Tfp pilus assembly ATPase PilB-like protein
MTNDARSQASFPLPPASPLATSMAELARAVERSWGRPVVSPAEAMWSLGLIEFSDFAHLQAGRPQDARLAIERRLQDGLIEPGPYEHVKATIARLPEVDAEGFAIEPHATDKLPWLEALHHCVLPLGSLAVPSGDSVFYAASARPTDRDLQNALSLLTGCTVMLAWAPEPSIRARLERETATGSASPAGVEDVQTLLALAQQEISVHGLEEHVYVADVQSSVVRLVRRIILDAHRLKASDVHIETNLGDETSRVRLRIDGELEEYLHIPSDLRAALVSRIKVMSKLDISERRRPQDGKINFAEYSDIRLELRVAIVPTHDNLEDVVMRLLGASLPTPLDRLGFSARDARAIRRMSERPYGLVLACGPTGSGKTTTLHSLISHLNTDNRKIWTAEDPIEITQRGLRQLQVNPKIGVTFASAMRAFLRADPDVIMIGEVRDEETARVCIDASLTGHLVMSTLHTNTSSESVVRLLELGLDPMNFADSLIGVVAQRLVRALCPLCKEGQRMSDSEFDQMIAHYVEGTGLAAEEGRERLLAAAGSDGPSTWRAMGCPACAGKGYKGRLGIYEILANGPGIKELIHARAPSARIFEMAITLDTRSLKQDALEKVVGGRTDLKQAETVYL